MQKLDYLIVFYEFDLRLKASETARKINKIFGYGTVVERTVQFWL